MPTRICLLSLLVFCQKLAAQLPEIPLVPGAMIAQSCRIKQDEYALDGSPADTFGTAQAPDIFRVESAVLIMGNDLDIDFQNATLRGSAGKKLPDEFFGVAVIVRGNNVRLRNLHVHGYKVAIWAEGCRGLRLENCDLSYNFRQHLRSTPARENERDWLSHHQNDHDDWLRYGAGIYLKNCLGAEVKSCRVTGGQNGLLMARSDSCLVWNNAFHFNSGLGIGLYRSSHNRLMHNRLDWNIRGYSHGRYQRGQDSAGILLYEQSSENLIAYNSATHSGDGFFLWAGQSTMDTGKGGCNDNIIFGNDFSHAATNGVEVTFSRNRVQGNLLTECTYGIWGGYSFGSQFMGNMITECRTGIAIEHGQDNTIRQNFFADDSTGVNLWALETQPADWGYPKQHDTRSRDCLLDRNVFMSVRKPLKISNSERISVNGENLFLDFEKVLTCPKPNRDSLKFLRNDVYGTPEQVAETWAMPEIRGQQSLNFSHPGQRPDDPFKPLETPVRELHEPDSLPGHISCAFAPNFPRGRKWIFVDEWGPYDFRRPVAWLAGIETDSVDGKAVWNLNLVFPPGSWKLVEKTGVAWASEMAGNEPTELKIKPLEGDPGQVRLEFEFTGRADWDDEFGTRMPAGRRVRFGFSLRE